MFELSGKPAAKFLKVGVKKAGLKFTRGSVWPRSKWAGRAQGTALNRGVLSRGSSAKRSPMGTVVLSHGGVSKNVSIGLAGDSIS